MERKRRSKRRFLLLALTFVVAAGLVLVVFQPAIRKVRLEAACEGADGVVIVVNVLPLHARTVYDAANLPSVEIVGSDKAQSLLDCITLKRTVPGLTCRCYGDMVFYFCRGSESLAGVSYHHGRSLRWQDGKWFGDAFLTEASQKALAAWLQSNVPGLEDAAATASQTTATQPADEPNRPAPR